MRLTLRTLLAYLDDRLPPANAREIGQKIASSPFATELAERIREVVRRRRLATSDESARLIDANLVAEYLDDQLTPELVARVEHEILKSDVSLAEVAATHEILGLLREPLALDPAIRDRLYAMDPSGKLQVVKTLTGSAGAGATPPAPLPASPAPEWKPLATRVSTSRRLPAILLTLLAAVWLIVIATDDWLFRSGDGAAEFAADPNADDVEPREGENQAPAVAASPEEDPLVHPNVEPDAVVVAVDPLPGPDASVPAGPSAPRPSGSTPDPAVGTPGNTSSAGTGRSPLDEAASANALTITTPDSGVRPADPAMPPDPVPAPPVSLPNTVPALAEVVPGAAGDVVAEARSVHPLYLKNESGMLLVQNGTGNDWKRVVLLAPSSLTIDQLRLHDWRSSISEAVLAAPSGFEATVVPHEVGWQVHILSDSVFQIVNSRQAGLRPLEGRYVISRVPSTEFGDDQPVTLPLRFAGGEVLLTLLSADARVAVEVMPAGQGPVDRAAPARAIGPPVEPSPPGAAGPGLVGPGVAGAGVAGAGVAGAGGAAAPDATNGAPVPGAVITDPPSEVVSESGLFPWNGDFRVTVFVIQGAARVAPANAAAPTDLIRNQIASWISLNTGEVSQLQTGDTAALTAALAWTSRLESEPIEEVQVMRQQIASAFVKAPSLREAALQLSTDRNGQLAAAAVRAMSVTRDVNTMMTILLQSGEELVRRAAIDGLQKTAVQSRVGSQAVRKALENRLPMNEVEPLFALIHGVTVMEARSPAVTADLITLLASDRLAARELAFYRMEQLVGDRFSYHADSDPGRRREAIRRWQRYVDRNNGQLLP